MAGADGRKRSWVKLDRYAHADLRRQHGLSAAEIKLLIDFCCLADSRNAEFFGFLKELKDFGGLMTATIAKAIEKLESLSLIEVVKPFGPNSPGRVLVLCYPQLTLDASDEIAQICSIRRDYLRKARAQLAHNSRISRTNLRESEATASANASSGGSAVERECGESYLSDVDQGKHSPRPQFCEICGQPPDDTHPFDHDPVVAGVDDPS